MYARLQAALRRRTVWYAWLPLVVTLSYWLAFKSLAFSNTNNWRIAALPKVFFDQTMYLQVLAKDMLHGFHILPWQLRPLLWLARFAWPSVSLSELYIIGIVLSAVASIWLFAWLLEKMGRMEIGLARTRALTAFLLVQAILVLRPGGPSWYVPFFLAGLSLAFIGEGELESRRYVRAGACWLTAVALSTIYPWYFATIIAICGLLFALRFIKSSYVFPVIGGGFVLSSLAFIYRAYIVEAVSTSYSVLLAVYGGIGWSHLTTLSNSIILMCFWLGAWLLAARRASGSGLTYSNLRIAEFMAVAWVAQLLLWFQSLATGLSIVPDHFIYTVWLMSAISWAVWPDQVLGLLKAKDKKIFAALGAFAGLFVAYVFVKIGIGLYTWTAFPSLLIHVGAWTFLACALLQACWRPSIRHCALLLGITFLLIGVAAIKASAADRALIDSEMDGVRGWIVRERPASDLRWCSDVLGSDYLFSATGQAFYPSISEKHDPVSITVLQNRLVEVSAFFNPQAAGELYIWDDMILHDLEFPCRAFDPAISLLEKLPLSRATKNFISGCDQPWADAERVRVIHEMAERWSEKIPQSSELCHRFVVRKRLQDYWRLPSGYLKLYEDETAAVYGIR